MTIASACCIVAKERLTLVPLSMLLKNGRVKVELALAKGRQKEDRRAIAEKESKLEMRRQAGASAKALRHYRASNLAQALVLALATATSRKCNSTFKAPNLTPTAIVA